jgi:hypothetical protein
MPRVSSRTLGDTLRSNQQFTVHEHHPSWHTLLAMDPGAGMESSVHDASRKEDDAGLARELARLAARVLGREVPADGNLREAALSILQGLSEMPDPHPAVSPPPLPTDSPAAARASSPIGEPPSPDAVAAPWRMEEPPESFAAEIGEPSLPTQPGVVLEGYDTATVASVAAAAPPPPPEAAIELEYLYMDLGQSPPLDSGPFVGPHGPVRWLEEESLAHIASMQRRYPGVLDHPAPPEGFAEAIAPLLESHGPDTDWFDLARPKCLSMHWIRTSRPPVPSEAAAVSCRMLGNLFVTRVAREVLMRFGDELNTWVSDCEATVRSVVLGGVQEGAELSKASARAAHIGHVLARLTSAEPAVSDTWKTSAMFLCGIALQVSVRFRLYLADPRITASQMNHRMLLRVFVGAVNAIPVRMDSASAEGEPLRRMKLEPEPLFIMAALASGIGSARKPVGDEPSSDVVDESAYWIDVAQQSTAAFGPLAAEVGLPLPPGATSVDLNRQSFACLGDMAVAIPCMVQAMASAAREIPPTPQTKAFLEMVDVGKVCGPAKTWGALSLSSVLAAGAAVGLPVVGDVKTSADLRLPVGEMASSVLRREIKRVSRGFEDDDPDFDRSSLHGDDYSDDDDSEDEAESMHRLMRHELRRLTSDDDEEEDVDVDDADDDSEGDDSESDDSESDDSDDEVDWDFDEPVTDDECGHSDRWSLSSSEVVSCAHDSILWAMSGVSPRRMTSLFTELMVTTRGEALRVEPSCLPENAHLARLRVCLFQHFAGGVSAVLGQRRSAVFHAVTTGKVQHSDPGVRECVPWVQRGVFLAESILWDRYTSVIGENLMHLDNAFENVAPNEATALALWGCSEQLGCCLDFVRQRYAHFMPTWPLGALMRKWLEVFQCEMVEVTATLVRSLPTPTQIVPCDLISLAGLASQLPVSFDPSWLVQRFGFGTFLHTVSALVREGKLREARAVLAMLHSVSSRSGEALGEHPRVGVLSTVKRHEYWCEGNPSPNHKRGMLDLTPDRVLHPIVLNDVLSLMLDPAHNLPTNAVDTVFFGLGELLFLKLTAQELRLACSAWESFRHRSKGLDLIDAADAVLPSVTAAYMLSLPYRAALLTRLAHLQAGVLLGTLPAIEHDELSYRSTEVTEGGADALVESLTDYCIETESRVLRFVGRLSAHEALTRGARSSPEDLARAVSFAREVMAPTRVNLLLESLSPYPPPMLFPLFADSLVSPLSLSGSAPPFPEALKRSFPFLASPDLTMLGFLGVPLDDLGFQAARKLSGMDEVWKILHMQARVALQVPGRACRFQQPNRLLSVLRSLLALDTFQHTVQQHAQAVKWSCGLQDSRPEDRAAAVALPATLRLFEGVSVRIGNRALGWNSATPGAVPRPASLVLEALEAGVGDHSEQWRAFRSEYRDDSAVMLGESRLDHAEFERVTQEMVLALELWRHPMGNGDGGGISSTREDSLTQQWRWPSWQTLYSPPNTSLSSQERWSSFIEEEGAPAQVGNWLSLRFRYGLETVFSSCVTEYYPGGAGSAGSEVIKHIPDLCPVPHSLVSELASEPLRKYVELLFTLTETKGVGRHREQASIAECWEPLILMLRPLLRVPALASPRYASDAIVHQAAEKDGLSVRLRREPRTLEEYLAHGFPHMLDTIFQEAAGALGKTPHIEFSGEPGHGPGPTREGLTALCKHIFSPSFTWESMPGREGAIPLRGSKANLPAFAGTTHLVIAPLRTTDEEYDDEDDLIPTVLENDASLFQGYGRALGVCLVQSITPCVHLSLGVCAYLTRGAGWVFGEASEQLKPPTWYGIEDGPRTEAALRAIEFLAEVDPELARSMQRILGCPTSGELAETLFRGDFVFSYHHSAGDRDEELELVPGGKSLVLDHNNRDWFIRLQAARRILGDATADLEALLNSQQLLGGGLPLSRGQVRELVGLSRSTRAEWFRQGLLSALPYELVSMLSPAALQTLCRGEAEIDVALLRARTQCSSTRPVVEWFWQVVEKLDQEKRERLLQFWTGSRVIPHSLSGGLDGHTHLTLNVVTPVDAGAPAASVAEGDRTSVRLPTASTCFFEMHLPAYNSPADLERGLLYALEHGASGFGLA